MKENNKSENLGINKDKPEISKGIKNKNAEENLVKDLKETLYDTVDESIKMLNTLTKEIQEKVKDESVKEETKNLVGLLSKNILNLAGKEKDESRFNDNFEQSNLEEE